MTAAERTPGGEPESTLAIEARGLISLYPDRAGPVAALRGLDLTVNIGELAAIVGPSGSGKTTLLRLLAGIERPSAGRLDVLGGHDQLGRPGDVRTEFDQQFPDGVEPLLGCVDGECRAGRGNEDNPWRTLAYVRVGGHGG